MTAINDTRTGNDPQTVRDIYNQFLAGRSTDDIASDLNTPRPRVGNVHSATGDQPGLDRLRALVAAGRVAHVLVYDMTRLSRNGRAAMELHEELSAGTRVTYVVPNPLPALINDIDAALAQYDAADRTAVQPLGKPGPGHLRPAGPIAG